MQHRATGQQPTSLADGPSYGWAGGSGGTPFRTRAGGAPAYWPERTGPVAQGAPYQGWRQMGLNEMLLDNGIIFLDLPLDPRIMINGNTVCSHVIKSMLHLSVRRDKDINLYINCPGGDIDDTAPARFRRLPDGRHG